VRQTAVSWTCDRAAGWRGGYGTSWWLEMVLHWLSTTTSRHCWPEVSGSVVRGRWSAAAVSPRLRVYNIIMNLIPAATIHQLTLESTLKPHFTQPCGDWYTGCWRVGCYVGYSKEGPGRAAAPPRPLLAVPNVIAHPSTASVQTSCHSMCHYNYRCALKGYIENVNVHSLHQSNWKAKMQNG